jgi:hypothetical protein
MCRQNIVLRQLLVVYVQTEHSLEIIIGSVYADRIYSLKIELLVVYIQTEHSLKIIISSVCADRT